MKKRLFIIALILTLIFLLFPGKYDVDDGGSTAYVAPLYTVTKYHSMRPEGGYAVGWGVEVLGMQVYYDVHHSDH